MKIDKVHIDYIKWAFAKMNTRRDFLDLLNYAKILIYGDKSYPFELKQLTYYSNPKRSEKHYKYFKVKKKSGDFRMICSPNKGLKEIQRALALILQCVYEAPESATGFVIGKSILDNAKIHTSQNYVFNIDIENFFPSIEKPRVWACLKLKPFNLTNLNIEAPSEETGTGIETGIRNFVTDENERISYSYNDKEGIRVILDENFKNYKKRLIRQKLNLVDDFKKYFNEDNNLKELSLLIESRQKLGNMISALSCTQIAEIKVDENNKGKIFRKEALPQGAPTSPVLSNIVCQRLDRRLTGLAKRFGLHYSRYADDITFSSMHNVYQSDGEFIKELERIVSTENFSINKSKTRLQRTGYRQEVTGLVVNSKVNVKKRYVKQIRMYLYYWEKYGYLKAEQIFLKDYKLDKGHVKKERPSMINVISGKLEYLKMIKGRENSTYVKLFNRFDALVNSGASLEKILRTWEANGIEDAMKLYYNQKV